MTEWIVANCHANAEYKAEANLKRQGFEVYLPRFKTTRRHARRIETVIRPLFPCYLFIKFNKGTTHWRPIRSTIGVKSLLASGDSPLIAPEWVIEELRQNEDEDGLFSFALKNELQKGDIIKITGGPLAERLGVFDGQNDSQRVSVLLEVMGRQVKTLVPLDVIRKAS